MLLVFIADFGMAAYRRMQVQHAAQAGAEYAMMHGFSGAAITSAVTGAHRVDRGRRAAGAGADLRLRLRHRGGGGDLRLGLSRPEPRRGSMSRSSAQAGYTTIVPYPGFPSSFTFTAASMVRIHSAMTVAPHDIATVRSIARRVRDR